MTTVTSVQAADIFDEPQSSQEATEELKTNIVVDEQQNVRLAQLDRAFGYGPKGREFESSNARKGNP